MRGLLETKTEAKARRERERARDREAAQREELRGCRRQEAAARAENLVAWRRHRRRVYKRQRKESDPGYMVKERLSKRLAVVIRGGKKSASTMQLVGCDLQALRVHIESQFLPGMNWENRALWHIDHIRPCASFDLTDPAQQAACFHYTNLRPLWARDNVSKGAVWNGVRWGGIAIRPSSGMLSTCPASQ